MDNIVFVVVDEKDVFFLSDGEVSAKTLNQKLIMLKMWLIPHFREMGGSHAEELTLGSDHLGVPLHQRSVSHLAFHLNSNYLVTTLVIKS